MNPARFMAHIQFQDRASEYRAGTRDRDALHNQFHLYPDIPEEEAANQQISAKARGIECALDALSHQFGREQWGLVSMHGRIVEGGPQ